MSDEVFNEPRITNFPKGTSVWIQDSPSDGNFCILMSGKLRIQSDISFQSKRLNYYQAGDTFGIVSGLTHNPHRNTLIAETDCTVVKVPLSKLGLYFRRNKDLSMKMIQFYSSQLRVLDDHLIKKERHEREGNPARLYEDARSYHNQRRQDLAIYALRKFLLWARSHTVRPDIVQAANDYIKKANKPEQEADISGSTLVLPSEYILFVENEPSDYFYVIKSGTVKITRLVGGSEFVLAVLGEGEIFGEMAILNQKVRNATAITFEETELLRLTSENFLDSLGEVLLSKVFESFARRIWYSYQRVLLLEVDDPVARLYAILQISISDYNARYNIEVQERYSFNFTLNDLKKMIGLPQLQDEKIRDFLIDPNIKISGRMITIIEHRELEEKATMYRNRMKKEHLKRIFV